jgi:hypothetical protein
MYGVVFGRENLRREYGLELTLGIGLAASVAGNIALFVLLKKKSATKQMSIEASEVLRDLLNGSALVKVSRVAPEDIFLRSPRGVR